MELRYPIVVKATNNQNYANKRNILKEFQCKNYKKEIIKKKLRQIVSMKWITLRELVNFLNATCKNCRVVEWSRDTLLLLWLRFVKKQLCQISFWLAISYERDPAVAIIVVKISFAKGMFNIFM